MTVPVVEQIVLDPSHSFEKIVSVSCLLEPLRARRSKADDDMVDIQIREYKPRIFYIPIFPLLRPPRTERHMPYREADRPWLSA